MRMRPLLILVLGVLLSACSDPARDVEGGPVGPSSGGGHLWGQVLAEGGGCIRGAMVEIVEGPGTSRKSGQPDPPSCDPWGEVGFMFDDLPLGATVTLRATASGYQPEERVLVVPAGGGPVQFVLQPN
jgi:hypothetical protein